LKLKKRIEEFEQKVDAFVLECK